MGELIPANYGTKVARFIEVVSDPQIMDVICYRVAEGESLRELARAWEIPYGKLARWLADDEGRAAQFAQVLEIRAHDLAEESLGIADAVDNMNPMDISKAKLQIDTRLKIAGKWDKRRYGDDKSGGTVGNITVVINRGLGGETYEAEITTGVSDAVYERETEAVYVDEAPVDSEEVGARISGGSTGAGTDNTGASGAEGEEITSVNGVNWDKVDPL